MVQVHQERVQATLNERKRATIKAYRDALADSLDAIDSHRVLRTLQAYIRSEEKDRRHALNRFKHLLRSGDARGTAYEAELFRKLRDIDLRVNGTVAMLKDEPKLEAKVKPVIVEFWKTFRKENSADVGDDALHAISDNSGDVLNKLIRRYKALFSAPIKGSLPLPSSPSPSLTGGWPEGSSEESTLRILDPVAEAQAVVKTRYDDIISEPLEDAGPAEFVAHARQEDHFFSAQYTESVAPSGGRTGLVLGVAAALLVAALALALVLFKRGSHRYTGLPTDGAAAHQPHPEETVVKGLQAGFLHLSLDDE